MEIQITSFDMRTGVTTTFTEYVDIELPVTPKAGA